MKISANFLNSNQYSGVVTHLKKLCPFVSSMDFLPVISSRRTTPKEKTSALLKSIPVSSHSGAKYSNVFSTLVLED